MKDSLPPNIAETDDAAMLARVGRATTQVVHDIKNQLNGAKLYTTFLRRRWTKDARPADELETLDKLNDALDRAAADADLLVRIARPLNLKKEAVEIAPLLPADIAAHNLKARGEFDTRLLTEALTLINLNLPRRTGAPPAEARVVDDTLTITWRDVETPDSQLFNSFIKTQGLRLALAAKIINRHGGTTAQHENSVSVTLPLKAE